MEQRQEIQMNSFRDQLTKLSKEIESIKRIGTMQSKCLFDLTVYFASLEAQVKSMCKTLDIDDIDDNPQ